MSSLTSYSMPGECMSEIESILRLPFGSDAATCDDFEQFEVTAEMLGGEIIRMFDYEACEFLKDNLPMMAPMAIDDDIVRLHITAIGEQACDNVTLLAPLAWLNRVVKVTHANGEVVGIFSDQTLRDCQYLHIEALPGKPTVPPLPAHMVNGISVLPRVFHFSFEQNLDASTCEVRRYLHQREGTLFMRELHTEASFSQDASWDKVFYEMWYEHYPDDKGGASATFRRFPAPSPKDNDEAECDGWRLRWASQTIRVENPDCVETYFHHYNENWEKKQVDDKL